ncbi:hypothetical protein MASR2M39_18200 [Ignavibacteriales bacterium]
MELTIPKLINILVRHQNIQARSQRKKQKSKRKQKEKGKGTSTNISNPSTQVDESISKFIFDLEMIKNNMTNILLEFIAGSKNRDKY